MEYLFVLGVSALWAGLLGRSKGSSFFIWFFVALGVIIPFLGVLIAVLYRHETDEVRRACPTCGKVVPLYDAICTRCGSELEFPEVGIEPASARR